MIRLTCPSTTPELQGRVEAGHDGVAVPVDVCGEGVEAGQMVPPDGVEPVGRRSPWRSVSMVAKERTCLVRASSSEQFVRTV